MKVEFEITQNPAKYLDDLWTLMTYNDKFWVLQMQSSIVRLGSGETSKNAPLRGGDEAMIELIQSSIDMQRSKTELLLQHFNQISRALGLNFEISDPFLDAENVQEFLNDMKGHSKK
jgi:hypothetical protein